MKRRNVITSILLIVLTFSTFAMHLSAAVPRKVLLADFCTLNHDPSGGFTDTINGTYSVDLSEFTTYSNLFILSQIDSELDRIEENLVETQNWVEEEIKDFAEDGDNDIYGLYYAHKASQICFTNDTLEAGLMDKAIGNMTELQDTSLTYGFQSANALEATIMDTALAVEFLNITADSSSFNPTEIGNFVLDCWDSQNGAFKGSLNGEYSLIDSYYALKILRQLNIPINSNINSSLNEFSASYYINESTYINHHGGYATEPSGFISSITSTYYNVAILDMLNNGITNEDTIDWLLSRQSPNDYGFQDYSESTIGKSSAKLSFYAISTLLLLDSTTFENSDIMNEDVWEIKSNGWVTAGVWVVIIGVITIACIGIYKYKNRI